MRWLVLDKILYIEKGVRALTRSHIPDAEYSSEVLMVEMMAQTGALLIGAENDFHEDVVFAKIESAEFEHLYKAGDAIIVEAFSENLRPEGAWIDAVIKKGEIVIARAKLFLICVGNLAAGRNKSITFHDAFMRHFNVREKIKDKVLIQNG